MMKLLPITILLTFLLVASTFAAIGSDKPGFERLSFKIDGHQAEWLATQKKFSPGEELRFVSTGELYTKEEGKKGPDGEGTTSVPCSDAPKYAVIGKLGLNGTCFLIGSNKLYFPKTDDFLYLWFNEDSGDNSNFFNVEVSITRPVCGDIVCAESEIGICYEDCDWCGDKTCQSTESCSTCAEDCNVCPSVQSDVQNLVEHYYSDLASNNFESVFSYISGDIQDYFKEMKRFKTEYDKVSQLAVLESTQVFSDMKFSNLKLEVGQLEINSARVKATFDEGLEEVKVEKIGGVWKITDIHDSKTWLSKRYDLNSLRQEHNDYVGSILPEEMKKSSFSPKIFIWILAIVILVGLFFGVRAYLNRKYIHIHIKKNGGNSVKNFFNKSHKADAKVEHKEEAKVTKPVQTKTCPKCQTKLFSHEKFCVKCGKKVD